MGIERGQPTQYALGRTIVQELLEPLQGRLSEVQRRTLDSLAKEVDPELLAEALLDFAKRAERGDKLEVAAAIYKQFEKNSSPTLHGVRARALRRLKAMEGEGEIGARAEFLLSRFVKEATDPAMIFAMGTAGALFRATRFATLSRLGMNPQFNFFTRGLGAHAAASLAGFSAEAAAFPLLGRIGSEALGRHQVWTLRNLGQEVASSFLVLGALRVCGHASLSLFRPIPSLAGGATSELGRRWVQQAGMFGGILLGHSLEARLGLGSAEAGSNTLIDSLALLFQFNIAGRLSREAFGSGFSAWERGIEFKTEKLARQFPYPPYGRGLGPQSAIALANRAAPNRGASDYLAMMGGREGAQGAAAPNSAARPDFHYPAEIEAAWQRVESAWKNPAYYEGSREELLAMRPNPEDVDAIWLHQAMDFARRIGAEVEVLDIGALREQRTDKGLIRLDPELFDRTLVLLGERGREGSLARRVLRVSISSRSLATMDMRNPQLRYLGLPPTVQDLEDFVGGKLRLMEDLPGSDGVVADFPSLSFTEALFNASSGRPGTQYHFVPGAIPRDQVMSLRARRVSPVGLARGLEYLGDLGFEIHPFCFAGHDGFFHAARDAEQADPFPRTGGWLYAALNRHLLPSPLREKLLDNLADSNLGGAQAGWQEFAEAVTNPLRLAMMDGQANRSREANREARRELEQVLKGFSQVLAEAGPILSTEAGPFPAIIDRLSNHLQRVERISEEYLAQGVEVSPPRYDTETLDAIERIEAKFQDPNYLQGTREELRRKRVNIEDADKLWYAQARDFARLLPDAEYTLADLSLLSQPAAGRLDLSQDTALLEAAFARLDYKSRSEEAGRVLVLEVPRNFMVFDSFQAHPELSFLRFDPFLNDLEAHLGHRLQFIEVDGEKKRYRIPSLALTESLLEAAYGEQRAQLHFVPGEISRDDTARLRGMRVSPVGLSFSPLFIAEFKGPMHSFSFAQHDAFDHASRDASLAEGLPEAMYWLYREIPQALPATASREALLNQLSDLDIRGHSTNPWKNLAQRLLQPLRDESPALSAALESLIRERFVSHPTLAARRDLFLRELEKQRGAAGLGI